MPNAHPYARLRLGRLPAGEVVVTLTGLTWTPQSLELRAFLDADVDALLRDPSPERPECVGVCFVYGSGEPAPAHRPTLQAWFDLTIDDDDGTQHELVLIAIAPDGAIVPVPAFASFSATPNPR